MIPTTFSEKLNIGFDASSWTTVTSPEFRMLCRKNASVMFDYFKSYLRLLIYFYGYVSLLYEAKLDGEDTLSCVEYIMTM